MKEQHQEGQNLHTSAPGQDRKVGQTQPRYINAFQQIMEDQSKRSLKNHIFLVFITLMIVVLLTIEWHQPFSITSLGLTDAVSQMRSTFFSTKHQYKENFLKRAEFYANQTNSITKYMSDELKQLLNQTKFYDIHNFINDQNMKDFPFIMNEPTLTSEEANQPRKVLKISKSQKQLEELINQMMYPQSRPKSLNDSLDRPLKKMDLGYFADELEKHPNSQKYIEAELYRYDKLYNIGLYEKQLPLCIIITGKNHEEGVLRLYNSIQRQNYTNYKIVHIDDNSNQETVEKYAEYFSKHSELRKRLWLLFQRRQRNKLFNKYFGVKNYCSFGDIVVQVDADDYLIGRQVFQLINTVYQLGNHYNATKQQLWAAYFNHISTSANSEPVNNFFTQIPFHIINLNKYRTFDNWRTTRLSTYLRDILIKINSSDLIDSQAIKKGDYYVAADENFLHYSLIEICGPKHLKFFDEYVYHYSASNATPYVEGQYSSYSAVSITPYEHLQSQDTCTTRLKGYKFESQKNDPLKKHETLKKLTEQVIQKRNKLKEKVVEMFNRDKAAYIENELKKKANPKNALEGDI